QPLRCETNGSSIDCPLVAGNRNVTIKAGLLPDKAFAGPEPLDLTKAFFPLGQQPVVGSAFYFTSAELFSKPKARAQIFIKRASTLQTQVTPVIAWEYWNGADWIEILLQPSLQTADPNFLSDDVFSFSVPEDMRPLKVQEEEALWMRARLVSGGYE